MGRLVSVSALALALCAGCGKPEDKLAKTADDLTSLLEASASNPKEGIDKVRDFVRDNLPSIAEAWAEALVELDKIENTAKREARAKEMIATLATSLGPLRLAAFKFSDAVAKDKDAKTLMKELKKGYRALQDALVAGPQSRLERGGLILGSLGGSNCDEAIEHLAELIGESNGDLATGMKEQLAKDGRDRWVSQCEREEGKHPGVAACIAEIAALDEIEACVNARGTR